MDNVLKKIFHESPLEDDNVKWFVDEAIKSENKMAYDCENINFDIRMTQEDDEDCRNNIICRFCEKELISDKVRDHRHLTGKHRGPVHQSCNCNATQKQSNFTPFVFHKFSKYDCHQFLKNLVDKKMIK